MEHTIVNWHSNGIGTYVSSNIKMDHTQNSITWTYTMDSSCYFNFSTAEKFTVQVYDSSQDLYYQQVYTPDFAEKSPPAVLDGRELDASGIPLNALMENTLDNSESYATTLLREKNESAFGTNANRNQIAKIIFLNSTESAPASAVDASQLGNGHVKAWAEKNGNLYNLYIAADGGVYAPVNASYLFFGMNKLTSISFGDDAFITDYAENMDSMFSGCKNLKGLVLTEFNTARVRTMSSMFYNCESLGSLNLSSFNTSNVESMYGMFTDCVGLHRVDVSSFDISNVTDMRYMFLHCPAEQPSWYTEE